MNERDRANALSNEIIGAAIEVHRTLGPGLLEPVYEKCLVHELKTRGIDCQRQVAVPIKYKGIELDSELKVDMIVEDCVLVELKTVDQLMPVHEAQLLTYLRLTGKRVGLLINFNVNILKNGVVRRVL